jgi:hypothetical protein
MPLSSAQKRIRVEDFENCTVCGCCNYRDFRFCQFCGNKRVPVGKDTVFEQSLEAYNAKKRILYQYTC